MFVFKCVPGIVTVGVPTFIASKKEFPAPKWMGSNNTSTQLHKEINSNKVNLFVNKTLLLRIEKFLETAYEAAQSGSKLKDGCVINWCYNGSSN